MAENIILNIKLSKVLSVFIASQEVTWSAEVNKYRTTTFSNHSTGA